MKTQPVILGRTILVVIATVLAGCGGSYGGGSGGQGPASLTISIEPTTITLGASATVTWSSNASRCTASGAWSGSKSGDGSQSVTPTETGTLTYSLVCSGGGYGESEQGSATLTVNAAGLASTWTGEACCLGAEKFPVEGITSESGELRFLGHGRHFVVRAGKPAIEFATCESCLAGALVNDKLAIDASSLKLHSRNSDTAALEGHYTTHLGSGYTLTVSIDAAGRMTGIDTRGCRFDGQARAATPASQVVAVEVVVSACGASDGHYAGDAALFSNTEDEPTRLLLSVSNAKSAIGWRLSR